jgi:hypothetical protein
MHLHTAIDSAPGIAATLRAERPRRKLAASVYCSKKCKPKIPIIPRKFQRAANGINNNKQKAMMTKK